MASSKEKIQRSINLTAVQACGWRDREADINVAMHKGARWLWRLYAGRRGESWSSRGRISRLQGSDK